MHEITIIVPYIRCSTQSDVGGEAAETLGAFSCLYLVPCALSGMRTFPDADGFLAGDTVKLTKVPQQVIVHTPSLQL